MSWLDSGPQCVILKTLNWHLLLQCKECDICSKDIRSVLSLKQAQLIINAQIGLLNKGIAIYGRNIPTHTTDYFRLVKLNDCPVLENLGYIFFVIKLDTIIKLTSLPMLGLLIA